MSLESSKETPTLLKLIITIVQSPQLFKEKNLMTDDDENFFEKKKNLFDNLLTEETKKSLGKKKFENITYTAKDIPLSCNFLNMDLCKTMQLKIVSVLNNTVELNRKSIGGSKKRNKKKTIKKRSSLRKKRSRRR